MPPLTRHAHCISLRFLLIDDRAACGGCDKVDRSNAINFVHIPFTCHRDDPMIGGVECPPPFSLVVAIQNVVTILIRNHMTYPGLTPNEECRRFVASYHHDGHWWILDIYAYDWSDAETRCKKLGLRLDGEFAGVVEGSLRSRAFVEVFCRVRTAVHRVLRAGQSIARWTGITRFSR